ncbi:unnamed protein product [Sphagnum jensenii]|uniref:Uncharacterized protein n=2 Tax=Sphagnum jensenii TaxID=128206 RepID=A0ABP1A2K6_9BRYO
MSKPTEPSVLIREASFMLYEYIARLQTRVEENFGKQMELVQELAKNQNQHLETVQELTKGLGRAADLLHLAKHQITWLKNDLYQQNPQAKQEFEARTRLFVEENLPQYLLPQEQGRDPPQEESVLAQHRGDGAGEEAGANAALHDDMEGTP